MNAFVKLWRLQLRQSLLNFIQAISSVAFALNSAFSSGLIIE
tara:strand:- start:115440 stop:115565 length:126 start_codon:yes stop_codon:yes gene_type:complete